MPNLPGQSGENNLFLIGQTPTTRYTGGIKIDWLISSSQRLSVRFTDDYLNESIPDGQFFQESARYTQGDDLVPRHSGFVSYTNTLTPTLVLDVRSSINRDYDQATPWSFCSASSTKTNYLAALGLPQSFINQLPPNAQQFPTLTSSGLGGDSGRRTARRYKTARRTSGATSCRCPRCGVSTPSSSDINTRLYRSYPYNQAPPSFYVHGRATRKDRTRRYPAAPRVSAWLLSNWVIRPAAATPISKAIEYQELDHGIYLQDDWKVNRKLTLNLGLRWEYQGPITDRHNDLANFNPTATYQIQGVNFTGGPIYPGVNGVPRGVVDQTWNHYAPRFGYAYQATSKLVARGGYGIFWVPERGVLMPAATGFTTSNSMIASLNNGLTPYNTIANPFPQGLVQPTGSSLGLATQLGRRHIRSAARTWRKAMPSNGTSHFSIRRGTTGWWKARISGIRARIFRATRTLSISSIPLICLSETR